MLSQNLKDCFLSLTRQGLGHPSDTNIKNADWYEVKSLADKQGLTAIVLDGLDRLGEENSDLTQTIPVNMKLSWIGEVMQNYEQRYELYKRTISEMAAFYNEHNYKMMVLKGYACSLDWPKPQHRPCGDIDIWLFNHQKYADILLKDERKINIDYSHHHHTVFYWRDFMVENHYDFINVHHHKSNTEFEAILKELGSDASFFVEICGEWVYLPSPNLHALFLLKHMMLHFASEGVSLRQVIDWGLFAEKHWKEVDQKLILGVLERFGMIDMFNIINAICVEDLGFILDTPPVSDIDKELKERVLNDILSPEYAGTLPPKLIPRVVYKIRRWCGNSWKHELCYKESMWSALWSGVWNHLLKPSSI